MSSTHRRLGPGWQQLPHFYDALNEATTIIGVLWWHPVYGRSRVTNQNGATRVGPPRLMDRLGWYDVRQAICATTKIILRDKWGEVPPTVRADELANIGKLRR